MRKLLPLILLLTFGIAFGQGNKSEFEEAKRLFSQENYRDAMGAFRSLTNDPVYGTYASFYYALSSYYQDVPNAALDMWKQILRKNPNWDQKEEVYFWISKMSFEKKRYLDGVKYANMLTGSLKNELLNTARNNLDLEELTGLYDANQENELLALLYFQALSNEPFEERDHEMLMKLSQKFDFDIENLLIDMPKVVKESYGIALVLPFMFDSLENPNPVIQNAVIFDLYQGMTLAQDSLTKKDISLEFFPFDTKKAAYKTNESIRAGYLDDADLIIGPLYPNPNQSITAFSMEKEIPMLNPLSANGSIVTENPLAFLFKPSYETQGRMAGEYAAKTFTENKNAMILFETPRDEVVAEAYKKVLERDSFNVVLFDQLDKEFALQLQVDFTDQYEELLDSLTQEEIDSIALIPNRFVRSRVKKDTITGRPIKNLEGEDELEYYEMRYTIRQDTLGHIFAATSNNLLANNIISMTDVRGDSIGVVGYGNWLNFRQTSYNQLERLNVVLINTSYFKEEGALIVGNKIREMFANEPSEYHLIGFELIMQVGHMFAEHGKYFHRGIVSGERRDGFLMEGLYYGSYKDNQVVPIITVKDLYLTVQNNRLDEESDE